jgi:two-component system CheB/CheR fusion protein
MSQKGNQLSVRSRSRKGSLATSNQELWSRNEELAGHNIQLKKTLERQHEISSHLQNPLYSADVAALFLDSDIIIRFFTPAAKSLFSILSSDLGRPLADLNVDTVDLRNATMSKIF